MHRPSGLSIAIGFIPFVAMCFSISAWDRVYPLMLGMPFNIFWIGAWIILTPIVMSFAYRVEKAAIDREKGDKML